MPGRRPKPSYLKLVTGNPGKRPINKNEPKPSREKLPSAPAELYEDAKIEWRRIARELHRLGLLTTLDRAALAAYCQAWGRWIAAERALAEMAKRDMLTHGLLIKTTNGNAIQNPLVGTANRAMMAMMRCALEFGMTPSARSRLSSPQGADMTNPFAEFGGTG
jgi:P27 family predicted phage terminase small subunit